MHKNLKSLKILQKKSLKIKRPQMNKLNNYLVLDEEKNMMDFLIQSLTFLSQVEQNMFFWKWFIISFHSTLYSLMILTLKDIDNNKIYKKLPDYFEKKDNQKNQEFTPFDGELISFLGAFQKLKDGSSTSNKPFKSTKLIDSCMKELNDKLRNQMIHFLPMTWGSESWYPAQVCRPLLRITKYCIRSGRIHLSESEEATVLSHISSINILLGKHSKVFNDDE